MTSNEEYIRYIRLTPLTDREQRLLAIIDQIDVSEDYDLIKTAVFDELNDLRQKVEELEGVNYDLREQVENLKSPALRELERTIDRLESRVTFAERQRFIAEEKLEMWQIVATPDLTD